MAKVPSTDGLLTARQAYCLDFTPDSQNWRKSSPGFQKIVPESTPAGLDYNPNYNTK